MSTGNYRVTRDVTIKPNGRSNGIRIRNGQNVLLYIDEGATLTVTGCDAPSVFSGYAAILLPSNSTLTIAGKGTLNATGGKGGSGGSGWSAEDSTTAPRTGRSGWGADGGGGAGAGIGTNGAGHGGSGRSYSAGGDCVEGVSAANDTTSNTYGNSGISGTAGTPAAQGGKVIITGSVTVNAKGGAAGRRGKYAEQRNSWDAHAAGTSGGGGGGGGGGAADGIGCGGTSGGGGGSGASANIDGECAFFEKCDLDDLWGHGGGGGASWGGTGGSDGEEGASNGGDSTGASTKYAKAGGAGGSCAPPKAVPFYVYSDGASGSPKVTCTAGNGSTREATVLSDLKTQAETGSWTETVDGAEVTYDWSITYYDESGAEVESESEPTEPGTYTAHVSLRVLDDGGKEVWSERWTVPYVVKRQVEAPKPADLTFQCADWATGEGEVQDAFPDLDDAIEFVEGAVADDGSASVRSAKDVGEYRACFRLRDSEACEWACEASDDGEIWVKWSLAPQEFDPDSPEISYWGTSRDNTTTTLDYTGEPVWVRPWFTPAKDTDGKFPEWFTHWGADDRPTTDRRASAVVYLRGEDDREGLVGYHTNDDGTYEPVTAEQIYVWANGADVDGAGMAAQDEDTGGVHVDVQSGDKVWYRTDEDGWKVPLAVGGEMPEGAEGYVIARDYTYADRLGVMEPGTYQAYALFDDGAGFAPTTLAAQTVEVRAAESSEQGGSPSGESGSGTGRRADSPSTPSGTATRTVSSTVTSASSHTLPTTGDPAPAGMAVLGLFGAAALVLGLRRRRG